MRISFIGWTTDATNGSTTDSPQQEILALPAPDQGTAVDITNKSFAFDELGPLVVNPDGTLSRIKNWATMTELERQRTLERINKRNQERLAAIREKEASSTESAS